MLLKDITILKWNSKNVKYYTEKGYIYTKLGKEFEVKVRDLSEWSKVPIDVKCDYCNSEYKMAYDKYNKRVLNGLIKKCACSKCQPKKTIEVNLLKYNEKSATCLKLVQEKMKNTMLEKYGVENASQLEEIKDKKKKTTLLNYGVDNPFKNKDIIKKIRIKRAEAMYANGTQICSRQQKYFHSILGGKLNYPYNELNLDIAFPEDKIYIEYDGSGHDLSIKMSNIDYKEFLTKERKRYYYMKLNDWKMIRIISKDDYVPNKEKVEEIFVIAKKHLETNSWITFNINNNSITIKNEEIPFNYGKLFLFKFRNGIVKKYNKQA